MSDFSEKVTTEADTGYTLPVYVKHPTLPMYGKIYEHDGNNGKMVIVNQTEDVESIQVVQYPNQFFSSVAVSTASDVTEFGTKYGETETILSAL